MGVPSCSFRVSTTKVHKILKGTRFYSDQKFLRKLFDSVSFNNSLKVNAILIFGIEFWPEPKKKKTSFSHWLSIGCASFLCAFFTELKYRRSCLLQILSNESEVCSQIVELISKWFKLPSHYCTQNGTN